MGKGYYFLSRLAEENNLPIELFPGQSIVELAGDQRLLIENHFGVKAYSMEKIIVNVGFGQICVCGQHLNILRMTREQLVICGEIQNISLLRRNKL